MELFIIATGRIRWYLVAGEPLLQQEYLQVNVNDFTGKETPELFWQNVPVK